MATITEDYVSFETAELLKEKGFNEPCYCLWNNPPNGSPYNSICEDIMTYKDLDPEVVHHWYLCPTLQMAMKWLRIEHNIHIEPHIVKTKRRYGYMPNYIDLKELKQYFPFDEFDFSNADKYVCITYDKACEVTIKFCLERLI